MNRVDKLRELKEMLDQGLISSDDYEASKNKILNEALEPEHVSAPQPQANIPSGKSTAFWDTMSDEERNKILKRHKTSIKVYKVMLIVFSVVFGVATLALIILFSVSGTWWLVNPGKVVGYILIIGAFYALCFLNLTFSKSIVAKLEAYSKSKE